MGFAAGTVFQPEARPLDVNILVLPEASLMSFAATLDPLRAANRIVGVAAYRWRVVSIDGGAVASSGGSAIPVDGVYQPGGTCDLLIVVASFNPLRLAGPGLLASLRQGAARARLTGGVEAGGWLLAAAGLLNGRQATTHWEDLEAFSARYPDIQVVPDRCVIDGPVFTTGGAAPTLDFMLGLIRARQGVGAAMNVASLYVYDEVRLPSDAQPLVSLGRIGRLGRRVADAIRLMEANLDTPIPVRDLAAAVGCGTRTLEMLFRDTLGTSPGAYYASLRLQAARRMIVDTDLPMVDVAVRTGFSSNAALSRAYRRRFGQPPSAARRGLQP